MAGKISPAAHHLTTQTASYSAHHYGFQTTGGVDSKTRIFLCWRNFEIFQLEMIATQVVMCITEVTSLRRQRHISVPPSASPPTAAEPRHSVLTCVSPTCLRHSQLLSLGSTIASLSLSTTYIFHSKPKFFTAELGTFQPWAGAGEKPWISRANITFHWRVFSSFNY